MAKKRAAGTPQVVPVTIDAKGGGPTAPANANFGDFVRFDNVGDTDRAVLYALDGSSATQFDPLCVVVPSYSSVTALATTQNNPAPNSKVTVYFKIRTKLRSGATSKIGRDDTYQVIISGSRTRRHQK